MIKKTIGFLLATTIFSFAHHSYAEEKNIVNEKQKTGGHFVGSTFLEQEKDAHVAGLAVSKTGNLYAIVDHKDSIDGPSLWFSNKEDETHFTKGQIIGLPSIGLTPKGLAFDNKLEFFFTCSSSKNPAETQQKILIYFLDILGHFVLSNSVPIHMDKKNCLDLTYLSSENRLYIAVGPGTAATDSILESLNLESKPLKTKVEAEYEDIFMLPADPQRQINNITIRKDQTDKIFGLLKMDGKKVLFSTDTIDGFSQHFKEINTKGVIGKIMKVINYRKDWYLVMTQKGVWLEKCDEDPHQKCSDPLLITLGTPQLRNTKIHTITVGVGRFSESHAPSLFVALSVQQEKETKVKVDEYAISIPPDVNKQK